MKERVLNKSLEYLKDWLRFRYEREEMPGFAVAISYKGKILLNEAYGYANLENKEKLTTQHIFRIASHSKTFTATAIMQLQEQGKLRIDDYVVDYLPWIKKHKDKRWQKVTIRQLLSHSAGIIRDGKDGNFWSLARPFPNQSQLKKEILDTKLIVDNNTTMKYSNYGYSLLGLIIETISGQKYNDYVLQHIVKTLKLKNTGPEYSKKISEQIVTGYSRRDVGKKRLPIANVNTTAMSPAAGFYSNSEDLCRYFTAHIVNTGELLNDESKKEMQRTQWQIQNTDTKEEYGLGFHIDYLGERRMFGHSGGFPGQITKSLCDPKDKLIVVVLTNAIDGWASYIANNIVNSIDYFQQNSSARAKHDLSKFEGRFMTLWSVIDVIAMGRKIVAVYPDSWDIFIKPDELKYVDSNTLKITKTSSFGSEGELVRYNFDKNNKVISLSYAADKFLPEKEYLRIVSGKKIIG